MFSSSLCLCVARCVLVLKLPPPPLPLQRVLVLATVVTFVVGGLAHIASWSEESGSIPDFWAVCCLDFPVLSPVVCLMVQDDIIISITWSHPAEASAKDFLKHSCKGPRKGEKRARPVEGNTVKYAVLAPLITSLNNACSCKYV